MELLVIVVLFHGLAFAELDGANHLAMIFQNRNQLPAPLLGRLVAVPLYLVARGQLPLAHPTNATARGLWANDRRAGISLRQLCGLRDSPRD
jgi:hypothetical protein